MQGPEADLREESTRIFGSDTTRCVHLSSATNGVRYFIVEEIARGAMGAVLRVHDPLLDRMLALKVLLEKHVHQPEMHARFLEEARLTSQLQHPGVVPVHDQGTLADGRPFFTMKLVEGRTLASLLRERAAAEASLPRLLVIFEQICQTIAYAHSRGVIHRDLKPSNVMVGTFGEVQVMDWGVAKHPRCCGASACVYDHEHDGRSSLAGLPLLEQTLAGTVVGTPDYMAPEQARGSLIDERADVFGLGSILCEILTGRSPYRLAGEARPFILGQYRDLSGAHAAIVASGADEALARLALDCLQEDPEARPRDAQTVARRLASYRENVEERLRQAEVERAAAEAREEATRAKVVAQRYARRMAGLLVGAVILVGGVVLGLHLWHEQWRRSNQDRLNQRLAEIRQMTERAQGSRGEQAMENWRELLVLLEQARQANDMGWADPSSLAELRQYRERVRQAIHQHEREQKLLDDLANIRVRQNSDFEKGDIGPLYHNAFLQFGIDIKQPNIDDIRGLLRNQTQVREAVIAGLDHWGSCLRRSDTNTADWKQPFRLAQELDHDAWRRRVRLAVLGQATAHDTDASLDALAPPGVLRLGSIAGPLRGQLRRAGLQDLADQADTARVNPASLLLLAQELSQEGMHSSAVPLLRAGLRHHPADVWLNYELARLVQDSDPHEALRYFSVARAGRPELGHTMAHLLEKLGRQAEAIDLFRDLIRLRPENLEHQSCLGSLYVRIKDFDSANRVLTQVIEKDPKLVPVKLMLSMTLTQAMMDLGRALRLAEEVLASEPGNPEALLAKARALAGLKRDDEAELYFRRAMITHLNPRNTLILYARFLAKKSRAREAIDLVDRVLRAAPDDSEGISLRAQLLVLLGRASEGEATLRAALQKKPDDFVLMEDLAIAYLDGQNPEKALPLLERAVRHPQAGPRTRLHWIQVLYMLGRVEQGSQALNLHFDQLPRDAIALYNLSLPLMDAGDQEGVIRLLNRALSLQPEHPESHCNLGLVYQQKGELALALRHLQEGHRLGTARGNWPYDSKRWIDQVKNLIAVRAQIPQLLDGTFIPSDPKVFAIAGSLCSLQQEHAAVFLLDQRMKKADPNLNISLSARSKLVKYESFLQAGFAQSRDAVRLSERERVEARQQALAGLQVTVEFLRRMEQQGTPNNQREAQRWLKRLRESKTLAWTRDPQRIAGLPASERRGWYRFWQFLGDDAQP